MRGNSGTYTELSGADLPSSATLHNGDSGSTEDNSEFSREITGPLLQWRFGDTLRSRSDVAMTNEALCKVFAVTSWYSFMKC